MKIDSGKMEKLGEKYFDAPCINCINFDFIVESIENFYHICPFFENGIVPDDIISGENPHTTKHPLQIKDGLFTARWNLDK